MVDIKSIELQNDVMAWGLYWAKQLIHHGIVSIIWIFNFLFIIVSNFKIIGRLTLVLLTNTIMNLITWGKRIVWGALRIIFFPLYEPFNLFIRILEYNVTIFIDFWLSLLFNTKLDYLFTLEYGKSQFKILVQWVRFINIMIITGLILGILTYYTSVRIIYWSTKLEKKKKKQEKERNVVSGIGRDTRKTIFGTFKIGDDVVKEDERNEILDEIDQDVDDFWSSQNIKPNKIFQEVIPNIDNNDQQDPSTHGEEDDDDIYNYESLNSLKVAANNNSNTNQSPTQFTSLRSRSSRSTSGSTPGETGVFDSIGSKESVDSNQGTGTTSIFSRLNLTPITTIEEDEEEEEHYK